MFEDNTEFILRSATGVENVACRTRSWKGITVRSIANVASPGKVWHDLSSPDLTVAVLLEQVGGMCETRHHLDRPVPRRHYGAGQIDIVPAGTTIWGVADNLRKTRSLRLYYAPGELERLLGNELDHKAPSMPALMRYNDRVFHCAKLLAEECDGNGKQTMYGEGISLALTAALFSIEKPQVTRPYSRTGLSRQQLLRAFEYFETNLAADVSLVQISAEVGLSQSRFAHSFKESTGLSPYRWFTEARITKAKELLVRKDAVISDIADATGFADQSHFTRSFRRIVGTTPKQWLRQR